MAARPKPKTPSQALTLPGTGVSCDLSALSAHIAAELACGLSDAPEVRRRYNISDEQWDILKNSVPFRQMLAEAITQWRGDLNASARITKKAEIVLEDAIPAYDLMVHDANVPAQSRIDAGKLLAQLAGRMSKESGSAAVPGGGFVLNINLKGQDGGIVIDGKNIPLTGEQA